MINDSSTDSTGNIIKEYSEKFPKVVFVDAKPKPDGWIGKNWACIERIQEGFRRFIAIY